MKTDGPTAAAVVVVLGTGSIGMRHLRVFREAGVRTIAVPRRAERVNALVNEGFEAHESLENARSAGGSHLVVATDTAGHLDGVAAGIELGFQAVLVEKPLAATAVGTDKLRSLASVISGRVFVGCNLRFEMGIGLFRERLGEIGEVHHVRIEAQSYLPDWRPERDYRESYSANPEQGGVLRDLIHEVDYAVWLFGRPKEVVGILSNSGRLGIAAEESADLLWRAPSGGTVSLRLDYVTQTQRRKMMAFGPNGELCWDMMAHTVTLRRGKDAPTMQEYRQERDAMMRDQAMAFLRAAGGGAAGNLATLDDGIFAIALCDAARESATSGRAEKICCEAR